MTEVKGPLFSLEAHGMLGDVLVYQMVNGKAVVKANTFPTYSRTDPQDLNRDIFSWCSALFYTLHQDTQNLWRNYRNNEGLVGHSAFMQQMLKRTHQPIWQFEAPPYHGFCITGNHIVGEFLTGGDFINPT